MTVCFQSKLPQVDGLPHCLSPLLVWLDEGRVSSHTSMYPILLRALFLPSQIRNGSGNGGGELAGHMVQVTLAYLFLCRYRLLLALGQRLSRSGLPYIRGETALRQIQARHLSSGLANNLCRVVGEAVAQWRLHQLRRRHAEGLIPCDPDSLPRR
jgi:hypothetical protein